MRTRDQMVMVHISSWSEIKGIVDVFQLRGSKDSMDADGCQDEKRSRGGVKTVPSSPQKIPGIKKSPVTL